MLKRAALRSAKLASKLLISWTISAYQVVFFFGSGDSLIEAVEQRSWPASEPAGLIVTDFKSNLKLDGLSWPWKSSLKSKSESMGTLLGDLSHFLAGGLSPSSDCYSALLMSYALKVVNILFPVANQICK